MQRAGFVLAGSVIFLLAFAIGLHLFFPAATVQRWLVAEISARTPVSLRIDRLSLAPVFTLRGRNATLSFDSGAVAPVVLDEIRLQPLWSSLLSGNPGIAVETTLLQGNLDASLRRSGAFALLAAGVKLDGFRISAETGALLSGTIVRGEWRGSSPPDRSSANRVALEMNNTVLAVLGQPLALGTVTIEGDGQGNQLRLTTCKASGGDLAISGSGTVLLGTTAAASRINLDLVLRPAASAPEALVSLLDLATRRQADDSYRVRLSGTPGQLALSGGE